MMSFKLNIKNRLLVFTTYVLAASFAGTTLGQQAPLPPGTTVPDTAPAQAPAKESAITDPVCQAEGNIATQNYDGARGLLLPWISAHPQDARAVFDVGYVEEAQGHDDGAAADYRKSIALDPKQFGPHLSLGLLLARKEQPQQAREQLDAAVALEPDPPNPNAKAQAYRALARLERTSDPAAARDNLLHALRLGPEAPDDALLTAEIAAANADDETAEAAYRRVLAKQPESSAAVAGLVHLLLKQKKYAEAEPLLRSAIERDPDDPALNSQLASTLASEGKQIEATAVLERLHKLKPDDALISGMLADTYSQSGNAVAAEAIYADISKKQPQNADIMIARGENLLHLQRAAEAVGLLQAGLKLKPQDADGWTDLAIAASEDHQYSTAIAALTARSKYAEETPGTYFLWATTYDNLHQSKSAEEYYHKFLTAASGRFPDQEWQAQHRLIALEHTQ